MHTIEARKRNAVSLFFELTGMPQASYLLVNSRQSWPRYSAGSMLCTRAPEGCIWRVEPKQRSQQPKAYANSSAWSATQTACSPVAGL